ncbi:hypothetical protein B0O80DRAFT_466992 [Mortierella sp. GBAus27b]|nr:hypothetical protein BGX31_005274 [Mortierella sp. GBA43]KAI8346709.1 hypothetical protein B0O80DRAFT_466992 [Mortierella sp. GBAus27b]
MPKPKKTRSPTAPQNHRPRTKSISTTETTATNPEDSEYRALEHLPRHAIDAICDNLQPSHLAVCALVSKAWSWIFTRILWRDLHVSERRLETEYMGRGFKQALIKHGQHIRTLKMDYYNPLESFFESRPASSSKTAAQRTVLCPHLESLEMTEVSDFDEMYSNMGFFPFHVVRLDETLLVRFLKQTSLTLKSLLLSPFPANRSNFLRAITEFLPEVKTLSLVSTETMVNAEIKPEELKRLLQRCPPKVEELTLRISLYDDEALRQSPCPSRFYPIRSDLFPATASTITAGTGNVLPIRKLTLGGDMTYDPDILYTFIRRCPHLESLDLQDLCLEVYRPLASTLKKHCPKLKELSIGYSGGPTDDVQLAYLIGASKLGWRKFVLHGVQQPFGPQSAIELRRHYKTLEHLELPKATNLPSECIRDLIVREHAPKLRHLDLMHTTPGIFQFYTGLELDARDLVMEIPAMSTETTTALYPLEWTCLNLVYLRIKIIGFPRTELIPASLRRCTTKQFQMSSNFSNELQRVLLGQIGRLVHLEELAFGNSEDMMPDRLRYNALGEPVIHERYAQLSSFSMTLEHGLNALNTLQKLRVLDVTCMTHKIGPRELSWMKLNWPKLERIEGLLHVALHPPLKEAVQWLKHNRLGWVDDMDMQEWCRAYHI